MKSLVKTLNSLALLGATDLLLPDGLSLDGLFLPSCRKKSRDTGNGSLMSTNDVSTLFQSNTNKEKRGGRRIAEVNNEEEE